METLLGLTSDPGYLAGYGPIAANTARELAATAEWRGILIDTYRHATAISTNKHDPPKSLREFVKVRDRCCRFPGCNNPTQDLDHVIPHPRGSTHCRNLQGLCRFHRLLKRTGYEVAIDPEDPAHVHPGKHPKAGTQPQAKTDHPPGAYRRTPCVAATSLRGLSPTTSAACTSRLPIAVASTGPATTGNWHASAVS